MFAQNVNENVKISIHALREEGDAITEISRRGLDISIHALREEGDPLSTGSVKIC